MSEAITKATDEQIAAGMREIFKDREQRYEAWEDVLQRVYGAMAALSQAGQGGQGEAVAWRHSRTLTLHETEEEVQLADADSWAEPLYLSAAQPAPVPAPVASAAAYFSYGEDSGYVEHATEQDAIKQAKADLKGYGADAMQDNEWPDAVESVCWGVVLQKTTAVDNSEAAGQPSFEYELGGPMTGAQQTAPAAPAGFAAALSETVQRSKAAPLGTSVQINPVVSAEFAKFQRGEPSAFDLLSAAHKPEHGEGV